MPLIEKAHELFEKTHPAVESLDELIKWKQSQGIMVENKAKINTPRLNKLISELPAGFIDCARDLEALFAGTI